MVHLVEHLLGHLGAGRVVEVDPRPPVDVGQGQGGEVVADRVEVQGHGSDCPGFGVGTVLYGVQW